MGVTEHASGPDAGAWVMSSGAGVDLDGRNVRKLFRRPARIVEAWAGLMPRAARRGLDHSAKMNLGLLADVAVARQRILAGKAEPLHDGSEADRLLDGSFDLGDFEVLLVDLVERAWADAAAIIERLAADLAIRVECWAEPTPLPLVVEEPLPIVSQLVDDLVSAPAAPPRLRVTAVAA